MPRPRNPKKSASKLAKEDKSAVFDNNFSALKKYKWTVEKANALLGSMIGLKPAGIHKHLTMLLIEEKLFEEINEHIPTVAIWEFINHYWDMNAADKLETQVTLPFETKDFCLPQTQEWLQLIEKEKNLISKNNGFKKDDEASTSNVSSDDPNQSSSSNVRLNDAVQTIVTKEELIRMTNVKVMVEKLK